MNNSYDQIFIQIASYRDPELLPTIKDCIAKAKYPERLTFGICWQRDETESLGDFINDPRFQITDIPWYESEGLGWARSLTQKLWKGEKYTMQLDSHHRFVQNWDEMVLEDYNQALAVSNKPIITTYCGPFDPTMDESTWNPVPCLMSQYEFSSDRLLMSMPWYIQDYKTRSRVIRARTISGHFYFTTGKFIEEVSYDPDIYFGGYTEETTLSLRAFTKGYDFYSPYRTLMWHEYTRNYRVKHWDDHKIESKTKKNSSERDLFARNKTRQLFGTEDYGIDMGIYGLGTERTLHDYEVFGGFDFKKCLIQDFTLKVNEPPNPHNWEELFTRAKYDLSVDWDLEFFKNHNFKKPKFLTLGIQTEAGLEIYRKDFLLEKEPQYVNLENNRYSIKLETVDKPNKIVMFLFDEEKQWSERYEKSI